MYVSSLQYFTSHVICCRPTPATATSLRIRRQPYDRATQAVCGGMLSRSKRFCD